MSLIRLYRGDLEKQRLYKNWVIKSKLVEIFWI